MSLVDPIREASLFACQACRMGQHRCRARPRAVVLTHSIRRLVIARRKDAPPGILMREGSKMNISMTSAMMLSGERIP